MPRHKGAATGAARAPQARCLMKGNTIMQFALNVNGKAETVDVEPETPLLWVLRDTIGLTGTKYGCGIARCGACTIHVDGQPMKACQLQASAAVGKQITTIEGLSSNNSHPV